VPQWSSLAGGGFDSGVGSSKLDKTERDSLEQDRFDEQDIKERNDKSIIFVGGKKAQISTKAPTAAAKARTGELRHNQSNIRREEKK
jgi:hypothetical protein